MHDLYKEEYTKENIPERDVLKQHMYRCIFHSEFNLGFHRPRKDSCLRCDKYAQGVVRDEDHRTHMSKKEAARQNKAHDKQLAKEKPSVHTCASDMEQGFSTPNTSTSTIFYKRKLSVYNLSVYSLGNGAGTCYLWSEVDGARGANEIGTCMNMYINCLPSTTNHIILYSDACGGQNRNRFFSTAMIYSLQSNKHITTINHKFMESGHSEMEH